MKAQLSIVLLLAMSCPAFAQRPQKTEVTRTQAVRFAQVIAETKPKASIDKAKAVKLKVDGVIASVDPEKFMGMAVGVITSDRYQFYYGETVKGNHTSPSHDTLFAIGSVTKTFTATLLALYNRRGLVRVPLAPRDPVKFSTLEVGPIGPQHLVSNQTMLRDLLPARYNLAKPSLNITLEQLADHHSGLPRNQENCLERSLTGDIECLLKQLATCKSNEERKKDCHAPTPLNAEGDYSNYAFAVLSHLLAPLHRPNATWIQALRDEILIPMGMHSTNERAAFLDNSCYRGSCGYDKYGECDFKDECNRTFSRRAAVGYLDHGVRALDQGSDEAAAGGAGVLWSTLDDQMTWLGYNMGLRYNNSKQEMIDILPELHTARDGTVGLAWENEMWDGARVVTKRGAVNGFHSVIAFSPSRGTGVVVLVNSALKPSEIAQKILAAL